MDLQGTYSRCNMNVEPPRIDQANLNTKGRLDLMAVGEDNGLSLHICILSILGDMRLLQQNTDSILAIGVSKEGPLILILFQAILTL
jgi:hypothetical protein